MENMLVFSLISGAMFLSASVQAQYKYTPKTPSSVNNKKKTYQFTLKKTQAQTAPQNKDTPISNPKMPLQYPIEHGKKAQVQQNPPAQPQADTNNRQPRVLHQASGTSASAGNSVTQQVAGQVYPLPYTAFKRTTLFSQRQKTYGPKFANPSKSFTMPDGTKFDIAFSKELNYSGNNSIIGHVIAYSPGLANFPSLSGPTPSASYPPASQRSNWNTYAEPAYTTTRTCDYYVTDYANEAPHIYPGAIYSFEDYVNGSFQSPSGSRNAIMLATDNPDPNGHRFISVSDPNESTIQSAIADMVSHLTASGSSGQITYHCFESNNLSDWTIKANAGGGNFGSAINNAFTTSNRSYHRYITIDVSRVLFSIFTDPPANGFFHDNSIESANNLMVIGSVAYGIRLLVNLELTFTTPAQATDFARQFNYLGYTNNSNLLSYLETHSLEITGINSYEIGGGHNGYVQINKNNLNSDINNVLSGATPQNAKPVRYSLYDMAWDELESFSRTNDFAYVNNAPVTPPVYNPVLTAAFFRVQTGEDGKNKSSSFGMTLGTQSMGLNSDGYSINSLLNYYEYGAYEHEWPDNSLTPYYSLKWSDNVTHPHLLDFQNGGKLLYAIFNEKLIGTSDHIKNFYLTLELNFQTPGQSEIKRYTITWGPLNYSTGAVVGDAGNAYWGPDSQMLHFKYSNGTFITTTQ